MFTRLRRLLAALAVLALGASTLAAGPAAATEPTNGWVSTAGGGGDLRYFDAAPTADGGVVLAGWSEESGDIDGIVRKLNADGSIAWTTRVGDDAAADWFVGVDVADDGTVFAVGQTRGDVGGRTGGTDFDVTIVKLTAAGAVQWTRQIGNNGVNQDDVASAVAAAPDGGVFVASQFASESRAVTTRYTGAGAQQWIFATGEPGDVVEDMAMFGNDAFFSGVRLDNTFTPVEGFLWSQSPAGTFSSDTRMPGETTMRVATLNPTTGGGGFILAGGDDYLATFAVFGLDETPLDASGRSITDVTIEQDGSIVILDDGSAILRGYDADRNAEPWSKTLAGEAAGGRIVATSDGGLVATTPSDAGFTTNNLARFNDSSTDGTVAGFTDVPPGIWYAEPVSWLKAEDITQGTSDTTFSPNANVTRAQMAAFLWRMVGEPVGNPAHGFADVPDGVWYDEPVKWLKDAGITQGTGADTYSPGANVTRAQMAAFLWRLAGEPGGNPDHGFADVPAGVWYDEPVKWLKDQGITQGTGADTYSPGANVTRAQMAAFLFRMATDSDWDYPGDD
ncbi:MAG: S-layer homology domain-containing protein [Actinomycetota bacterium]